MEQPIACRFTSKSHKLGRLQARLLSRFEIVPIVEPRVQVIQSSV